MHHSGRGNRSQLLVTLVISVSPSLYQSVKHYWLGALWDGDHATVAMERLEVPNAVSLLALSPSASIRHGLLRPVISQQVHNRLAEILRKVCRNRRRDPRGCRSVRHLSRRGLHGLSRPEERR